MFASHIYAFHQALTPNDGPKPSVEEFLRDWTPGDIHRVVYDRSDTDLPVAMPLPLTDLFREGLSPWEECAGLASPIPTGSSFGAR
jgi:hypothetical protein